MARKTPKTSRNDVLYWHKCGKTIRWIAKQTGIARPTISRIIRTRKRVATISGEIEYYECETYHCDGCKHDVTIRPCPYCEAMKWKKEHGG